MTMTAEQLTLLLNTIISVFLPALVGLITQRETNETVKSLLLLLLSVLNVLIGQIVIAISTGNFDWFTWIIGAIASFVIGVGVHFGFWKPVGATEKLQKIGSENNGKGD
jgi:predicted Na+-dependent transporter